MPKLSIDGIEVEVEKGTSVLQACEQIGIEIPRFCYHDKLSVPANCRMCLVEIENSPKPMASCALPCADGMVVKTQSDKTKKARKGVMEFLLINHPLDCPICDQGGECDLQDQAMAYGFDKSRFNETKRSVAEKDFGPLIKTFMTRCVHCTRCVRFADEIAGTSELCATNRSENMEIGTYIGSVVTSELSGNMIDICPVGALTSKPYSFNARPWELRKNEAIDVMDAVGSNIRVDIRGGEVMRILPRLNEDVNEEWISDKTRFAYDGLKQQRLDTPYIRENGKLVKASWDEAFAVIQKKLKGLEGSQIGALAGDLCDLESIFALKKLMHNLGSKNLECRVDGAKFDPKVPAGYLFNTGIAALEQADLILLVGTNPRYEASLVNARIRKRYLAADVKIGLIGAQTELTYPYEYIGAGTDSLEALLKGSHPFSKLMKAAKNPVLIVGIGAFQRPDAEQIQHLCFELAEKYNFVKEGWNGYNMLHTAASRVGALLVGFVPSKSEHNLETLMKDAETGAIKALYLLGVDEIDFKRLKNTFVIYQGHHGDQGAQAADVILPGAAYTEKDGTYVNLEGRVQHNVRSVFPLGEAKEDWKIIRALSDVLKVTLSFDSLPELRQKMAKDVRELGRAGEVFEAKWTEFGSSGKTQKTPFVSAVTVDEFYMTNSIARHSKTMAACVQSFVPEVHKKEKKYA